MAKDTTFQRSFGAGELDPALAARADLVKYATGLRTCRNFYVRKGGGISFRSGTRFIAECKTASPDVILIPYLSEIAGESVLIECGSGYFRFFVEGEALEISPPAAYNGGTQYVIGDLVESGGDNYYCVAASLGNAPPNATFWYLLPGDLLEIPHPFDDADKFPPYWHQSGRTITLTHPEVEPHELIFENLERWIIREIDTEPDIDPPTNVVLTPGTAGTRTYAYVVTAAKWETYEESEPSSQVINAAVDDPTPDAPHVLTWDAPAANTVEEWYVYGDPYANGIYGFLGIAASNTFNDPGLIPDYSITPPIPRTPFASADNYPGVSATHQQRRMLANTNNAPDAIWGSRIGFPSNFGITSPVQDDNAINFKMAGNHHHPVRHMFSLKSGLIVLTDAGEWTVRGGVDGALTPSSINADQETYVGVYKDVRPVVVGNAIIYIQARGSIPRDLRFDQEVEGLAGRDLSVFASHLFKNQKMRDIDFAQDPDSIVWIVREDGVLLGLTYLREQDVWGWHQHFTGQQETGGYTDGFFWDVCVVPEPDVDAVYFIVRRTIDGNTVRYIERLEQYDEEDHDGTCFFVDSGLSHDGAAVNNVTNLDHLVDQVVAVVGNGVVLFNGDITHADAGDFKVTGSGALTANLPPMPGKVSHAWSASTAYVLGDIVTVGATTYYCILAHTNHTPPNATYWSTTPKYTKLHIGLPIRNAEFETLDLDVQGDTVVRDKRKRVYALDMFVLSSCRTWRAGPSSSATLQAPTLGAQDDPTELQFTGLVELTLNSHFNKEGRIYVRQSEPQPLTVLGILPHVDVGG